MEEDGSSAGGSVSNALSEVVRVLGKAITGARDVGEVTEALLSLASLLQPHNLETSPGKGPLSLELTQLASVCREEAQQVSLNGESSEVLTHVFYGGSMFPIVAKILLFGVAPDWLACFSSAEQVNLFDLFFTLAPPSEAVTSLVPALAPTYNDVQDGLSVETSSICKVAERLLVLCLFENGGLRKMVLESAIRNQDGGFSAGTNQTVLTLAQLIASIPDKARPKAPSSLLSPYFHLSATLNFLEAVEEYWTSNAGCVDNSKTPFVFTGELLARFCRRGHADAVASQMLSKLLKYMEQRGNAEQSGMHEREVSGALIDTWEIYSQSNYWTVIMSCMKDVYAVERLIKALMLEMTEKQVKDQEAYRILCILFPNLFESQTTIRSLFTDRFLLWTVLPICCLRWVLQFAVFRCPPEEKASNLTSRINMDKSQKDVIKHLVEVWAEDKFIQSVEMQQQSYITAAIGLSLRVMTKKDLECSDNVLQSLLRGISCRLESPLHLVRMMAKRIALEFSLVVDQTNPLLLDEDDRVEDLCDWGVLDSHRSRLVITEQSDLNTKKESMGENTDSIKKKSGDDNGTRKQPRMKGKKDLPASEGYDPDEVIDLRTYSLDDFSDDHNIDSSDLESECSLQPYDLSDDESDLHRDNFPMQLSDCAANLRKGDEPDLVEKALEVVEKLVRAAPEELENAAPDLAQALIHVRCSEVAVEGQEQSAEKKRYRALVALLACAPLTVEVFTHALYSPHVDVSQRLLVLEVMSNAAKELAASGSAFEGSSHGHGLRPIMEIDKTWYGPGSSYTPIGAGPWKEVHEPDAMVSLIHKYEREMPQTQDLRALGKSRRWGHRSMQLQKQQRNQARGGNARKNNFVPYVASFMLPVMRDYDKKQHGVDFLGRDFVVLGRLICMLGVCIECVSLQPEAFILAASLLNMLRSKQISSHPEAYVRRASLYAASRIMVSLHPSQVANAISSGDVDIASGLDWIRGWALRVAEDDSDTECSSMAMACLHLHSEVILQASRSLESEHTIGGTSAGNISYKAGDSNMISFL